MRPSKLAAVVAVGIQSGGTIFALVAAILLARLLGPDGYGAYAFGISAAGLVAIVASLGTPSLAVRETGRSAHDPAALRAFQDWALGRVVLGSGLGAALLLGAALAAPVAPTLRASLVFAAVLAFALALVDLGASFLRGLGLVNLGIFLGSPLRNLGLLAVVVLAWFGFVDANPAIFLGTMVLVTFLAAALVHGIGRRRLAHRVAAAGRANPLWRAEAWALLALAAAWALQSNLDVLLVGFLGTPAEIGVYGAAQRGATLVAIPFAALNSAMAPALAAALQRGVGDPQAIARRGSRWNLLASVPVAAVLLLWGSPLLNILGPGFQGAYAPMALLCVAQVITAGLGPAGLALNLGGKEGSAIWGLAIGAGVNLSLAVSLIPVLGALGAAIATTMAMVAWNVSHAVQARRRLGLGLLPWTRRASV